jgi:Ca-activated chloride channel family protein
VRASLNNNVLPQKDAVRIEELVNYFPYDYQRPSDHTTPFCPSPAIGAPAPKSFLLASK